MRARLSRKKIDETLQAKTKLPTTKIY